MKRLNPAPKKSALRSIEVPKGLRDLALTSLKEAILSGDLAPGVMFSEMEIAEQLGISRTPIREALLDLSSKGFIVFIPRRGFQIREITETSIRQLYVFRMILETAIIKIATPRIDTKAILYLESLHKEDKKAAALQDMHRFINTNRKFHEYIAELTANRFLIDSYKNVRELIDLANLNIKERYHRMVAAVQEHKSIIDCLKKRDTEGAVAMMERHIHVAEDLLLRKRSLEQQG
jgi:DNA-binding GntR family transcriptional regulator